MSEPARRTARRSSAVRRILSTALGCLGLLTAVLGGSPLVAAIMNPGSRSYYLLFAVVFLPLSVAAFVAAWRLSRNVDGRSQRARL